MATKVPRRTNLSPQIVAKPPPPRYNAAFGDGVRAVVSGPVGADTTIGLRQAIYDALHEHAPGAVAELASQLQPLGIPREVIKDWERKYLNFEGGGFTFDVWQAAQRVLKKDAPFQLIPNSPRPRRIPSEDVMRRSRRRTPGAVTLEVNVSWPFALEDVASDDLERVILDHLRAGVQRELHALRMERDRHRPKGRDREHLARDATRLVLREVRSASAEQIMIFECDGLVTLDDDSVVVRQDLKLESDAGAVDEPVCPTSQRKINQRKKAIEESIRVLADAVGLTLKPRTRGHPRSDRPQY
jgi:hypothetical protein